MGAMTLREIDLVSLTQLVMRHRGRWRGSRTRICDIRSAVEECAATLRKSCKSWDQVSEDAAINELMKRARISTTLEAYR